MNTDKIIKSVCYTLCLFIVFCITWSFLEILLYGCVQNRLVDNIISVPIIVSFYLNVKYYICK